MPRGGSVGFSPAILRRLMQRSGLTTEDLADQLGLSRQSVSAWLTGRTTPSPPSLVRIAEVLNATPADLTPGVARGLTLADMRVRAGLTQSAAAAEVGLAQTVLSQIERGRREVQPETADELARLYQLPVEDVIDAWDHSVSRRRDDLTARRRHSH